MPETQGKAVFSDSHSSDSGLLAPDRLSIAIVLVSWGRIDLLRRSLGALCGENLTDLEIVIVREEGSDGDEFPDERVTVRSVPSGASFAAMANEGGRVARADLILFLKEGVELREGAIASTCGLLSQENAGVVGSMLVDPKGVLLEAGSLLFSDGICFGFGRGWNPDDYRVQYRRSVAFSSAACLGTRKALFEEMGGFDERYQEEYYEDVDYCLRVAASGRSVIYDPESVATWHEEHRDSWEASRARLEGNRERFSEKWSDLLPTLGKREDWDGLAVFEKARGARILWVEDAPPFTSMGAGFPRTREMLAALLEMDFSVTLLPTFITSKSFNDVYRETPREVEVVLGVGIEGFGEFWNERERFYEAVIVSRPNNLKALGEAILETKKSRPSLKFVYDAEAVFVNRDINECRLAGAPYTKDEELALLEEELAPARGTDCVLAISEIERNQFESLGFDRIRMVRHYSEIIRTKKAFGDRKDILFVGAVHSDGAPNALGLIWFIEEVLPLLRDALGEDLKLYFAGKNASDALARYASDTEVFLGFVEDLDEWYDRCRIFIAPARFAAGIPLKIIEAASRGIPVVAAQLAREQLGWHEGEMLAAGSARAYAESCVRAYTDEALWLKLREGAIKRLQADYSKEGIARSLSEALDLPVD